jgi:hypothetical protein
VDEYGHDESTLLRPPGQTALKLPSGRLAVPLVKLIEIQQKDTRMGRSEGTR